jgi:glycosyltransferase involved in cell wall biosynthesis
LLPGTLLTEAEGGMRSSPRESVGTGRIKVCHIASGDLWAGAEVQIATLLRFLARQPGLELSVILLNQGRLAEEVSRLSVALQVIPEDQFGFLGIFRRASEFLQGRNVKILHSHRYKENFLAALLAWRRHIPVVLRTQHGMAEPRTNLSKVKQGLLHGLDRLTARRTTDCIIGVSSDVSYRLGRQLNPKKIVTILNGIDLETVRSSLAPLEAKRRLGLPPDCLVIGTAGRLEPVKRLDIFLEAAKQISARHAKVRFVITGDGRERASLSTFARELGVGELVLFLGHRYDVYDVLRAFDLLVLSSDDEGLPMVLLEAMALGVVVVARAVGGLPEVIQDGKNGVLVHASDAASLANACVQVLGNSDRMQQLAEAATTSVAQHYSAERTANGVTQLYHSLVGLQ